MDKEVALKAFRDALETQRGFAPSNEPYGWDGFITSKADDVKAAYPNYGRDKAVVLDLIEAGALSHNEAVALPPEMLSDRDVALAFAVKDPMRHDMGDLIPEAYLRDKSFMLEAVKSPHPDKILSMTTPVLRNDPDVRAAADSHKQYKSLGDLISGAVARAGSGNEKNTSKEIGR